MHKKIGTVVRRLRTTVQHFSCLLCSQIICTSTFKLVSPTLIASDWKPTLVFHVNKLVTENDSFCSGKSGKMNSAE